MQRLRHVARGAPGGGGTDAGQTLGKGRLGVGIAALVAHLRMSLRLPIRRIQAYLADLHGLRVSVGEVVDLLRRVGERGVPTLTQIRDTARSRAVVHADETTWRESGQNGYAWLLATPEGERYVEYHHSRAGAVANALLGEDFRGVLVSDFYGGYNDTPGGRHQRCWVHLLRDARTLRDTHAADLSFQGRETRAWAAAVLRRCCGGAAAGQAGVARRQEPPRLWYAAPGAGPAVPGRSP